ncbi:MAG: hypothetical protein WD029_09380, partial [Microthrixaceae bacterium]
MGDGDPTGDGDARYPSSASLGSPETQSEPPTIAVLDYGIGNLRSAEKALEHVGAVALLTADEDEIAAADAVVLPGVGSFGRCREALAQTGL